LGEVRYAGVNRRVEEGRDTKWYGDGGGDKEGGLWIGGWGKRGVVIDGGGGE